MRRIFGMAALAALLVGCGGEKSASCVVTTGSGCPSGSCQGNDGVCDKCEANNTFCTTTPSGCGLCPQGDFDNGVFCCIQ
jgi:hypothetical protein